jgi:DNA-binding MarR family transcriptional regulator
LLSAAYEGAPGWPPDLTIAQFSLLQAIVLSERTSHSGLAWLLGLDQTTVSRSLAGLEQRGLIRVVPGEDRRERYVALTAAGKVEFRGAERAWREVQGVIKNRCGTKRSAKLEQVLTELAAIAASLPGVDARK